MILVAVLLVFQKILFCSSQCDLPWVDDNTGDYCYYFSDNIATWFVARTRCESLGNGSYLASINTDLEQAFINETVFGNISHDAWIGLNSLNIATFQWVDGSPFGYSNWYRDEPNNRGGENCVHVYTGDKKYGKWNDKECGTELGYICKKRRLDRCNHTDWSTTLPDVVFILDSSSSQGNAYFQKQLEYVERFISYFHVGPELFQFSVISYSFDATIEFKLNEHRNKTNMNDTIRNIAYLPGPSYTHVGLRKARIDVFGSSGSGRRSRPGVVIVLSDGLSSNLVQTEAEAVNVKSSGFELFSVAIGPQILHKELLIIASSVLHVYPSTNTDLIHHIYRKYAPNCPECVTRYADVWILLEVSKDLTKKEFNELVNSLKFLLQVMNIGVSAVRISLTHFWSEVTDKFSFDTYSDKDELIAYVVSSASQKDGSTNAGKAFDYVIQSGFQGSNRKVLLVLSSARYPDIDDVKTKAQQLKSDGVYIVTIGVGLKSDHANLLDIASDPAFSYLTGDDVHIDKSSLQALLSTLEYEFCDGYVD